MSERRAVILAGGRGTRLRPYTTVLPKPLMPIGDYPILEVVVRQLARAGYSRITMAVNHQASLIQAFFGDGAKWGISIDYSLEEQPLGTMGCLRIIPDLPDHFLVMNGDLLTDFPFRGFLDAHAAADRIFTVATYRREVRVEYGVLEEDASGHLSAFREKPGIEFQVSMGIYGVSRRVLTHFPPAGPFGFDQLMLGMLERGKERPVLVRHSGFWLDIGRPDDYEEAIESFAKLEGRLLGGEEQA